MGVTAGTVTVLIPSKVRSIRTGGLCTTDPPAEYLS